MDPTSKRPRGPPVLWIGFLYSSGIAEATSNYLLPDTIHRFTQNAFVISVILSLNPLFGFVAQPWAGWYSDRIWTPLGRRLPLLLLATAGLAMSCLALPFSQALADRLPWLGDVLRFLGAEGISTGLAVLSCWIFVYQFVVDVIAIMIRCLVADVIPAQHRGTAFAVGQMVSTGVTYFTLRLGGGIAAGGEWKWYALVAAVACASVLPALVFLKEPHSTPPLHTTGRWRDYVRNVRETPYFLRLCIVIACTFAAGQLITNYYRLFTMEQLHLSLDEALQPFAWMPFISFFASFPIGWLCDRVSLKHVTLAGALLLALAGAWGAAASTIWDLRIMAVLVGLGLVCIEIAINAYLISFLPPGKIGQLSGFANVFRGGPRFLMFFGAGALIELFGRNYRIAFVGAVACSLVAVMVLSRLPKAGSPPPE